MPYFQCPYGHIARNSELKTYAEKANLCCPGCPIDSNVPLQRMTSGDFLTIMNDDSKNKNCLIYKIEEHKELEAKKRQTATENYARRSTAQMLSHGNGNVLPKQSTGVIAEESTDKKSQKIKKIEDDSLNTYYVAENSKAKNYKMHEIEGSDSIAELERRMSLQCAMENIELTASWTETDRVKPITASVMAEPFYLNGQKAEKTEDISVTTPCLAEEILKHHLATSWTLWYYRQDNSSDWETNQRQVASFSTVEDFWSLISHIEEPSGLEPGRDYSLFRKNIKPMWEDSANNDGGRWLYGMNKQMFSTHPQKLDKSWIDLMMCLVGEAFGKNGAYVNGAVVNRRKNKNKISIWLRTAKSSDEEIIKSIGVLVKERCVPDGISLHFEEHRDSIAKSSSYIKARYEI